MKFNQKLESISKINKTETIIKMENIITTLVTGNDEILFKSELTDLIKNTSVNSLEFSKRLFDKLFLDSFSVDFDSSFNNRRNGIDSKLTEKINNALLLTFTVVNGLSEELKFGFILGFNQSFESFLLMFEAANTNSLHSEHYHMNLTKGDILTSTLKKIYGRWSAMLLFGCVNNDSIGNEFKNLGFSYDKVSKSDKQLAQLGLSYKTYLSYFFDLLSETSRKSESMYKTLIDSLIMKNGRVFNSQPFQDIDNIYAFAKILFDKGIINDKIIRERNVFSYIKNIPGLSSLSKITLYKKFLGKKSN